MRAVAAAAAGGPPGASQLDPPAAHWASTIRAASRQAIVALRSISCGSAGRATGTGRRWYAISPSGALGFGLRVQPRRRSPQACGWALWGTGDEERRGASPRTPLIEDHDRHDCASPIVFVNVVLGKRVAPSPPASCFAHREGNHRYRRTVPCTFRA